MDFAPVLRVFRMVAPEFKDVADETVNDWIELCSPFVSQRRFRKFWAKALALLTAHRMKLAGVGENLEDDPLADISKISIAGLMRVGSFSEGSVSIGLNANVAAFADSDSEYGLTVYGVQFKNLIRMLMSITSAGERRGRIR